MCGRSHKLKRIIAGSETDDVPNKKDHDVRRYFRGPLRHEIFIAVRTYFYWLDISIEQFTLVIIRLPFQEVISYCKFHGLNILIRL